jgi:acetyl esterase
VPVDRNLTGLLTLVANSGHPRLAKGTVEDARVGFRTLMVDFRSPATLPQVGSVSDETVAGRIPVRVYRPAVAGSVPTVVFFHGGGWVIGDLDTHEGACRLLCNDVGAVVVSVDYRRAPEHRFPAALEDSYAALSWVAEHIADFGADATRLAVAGDSAGGNLAAACALQARDAGLPLAAQALAYPAVDLLGDYPSRTENADGYFVSLDDLRWFAEQYLGMTEADPRALEIAVDPRISPLRAATLEGLAPAVVLTGEFDPLRDEGNAYARALEKAGVRVEHREAPGLIHGFFGMELFSPVVAEAMSWINARLKDLIG